MLVHMETKQEERLRKPERVAAIDALRGFDMFWITGGLPLFLAACGLFWDSLPEQLVSQATHRAWEGFSAWDLIMPLFLFIVGATMPFSFAKYKTAKGTIGAKVYGRIAKRVVLLFLFGMIAQGNLLSFRPDHIKLFCNTLQAIAGGYLISALVLLHFKRAGRVVAVFGLLVVYWAILRFVPFGGFAAGTVEPYNNIALYWDKALQGDLQDGTNYTWILSQPAFGAMTLCGAFGGDILKSGWRQSRKVLFLSGAGLLCLAAGYAWSFDLAVIKRLFTPSMVLWSAGWCYLLLTVFYLISDVWGWKKLFFPFRVIGSNAIFVYMWVSVCSPENNISRALFGGFSALWGEGGHFVFLLCNYLLIWSVLFFLYRKKIFFRL